MLCCVYEYKTFRHFIKLHIYKGYLSTNWQNLFSGFQYYILGVLKYLLPTPFNFHHPAVHVYSTNTTWQSQRLPWFQLPSIS